MADSYRPAAPGVPDIPHKTDVHALNVPPDTNSQVGQQKTLPENADTSKASQPRYDGLGLDKATHEKPKRLLKYDVWKPSTSPVKIPATSPTKGTGNVPLSMSLPESLDAFLSRCFVEQCQLDEQLVDANPRSSEASWISRWWSSNGDSNDTSLSTCKTEDSAEENPATPEDEPADDNPIGWKQDFFKQQKCYASALSMMLRKDNSPEPLCPPKHELWAVIATARKVQPSRGKLARCSGQGNRKVQSCPTPQKQRLLDEASLSPSSASQPRAIPLHPRKQKHPKETSICATSEVESMDTTYTRAHSGAVTDSLCNSTSTPGLISPEEQKSILLGRLMEYFFAVLAKGHNNDDGTGSSSQTASSSAEPVATVSSARSSAWRGVSRKGKRSASAEDDGSDGEENEGPRMKKAKIDETEVKRLACPFFKRDPHRYKDQSKCVGPGWTTVHRLKEHIYRRHRLPVHCLRCHHVFPSHEGLEKHSQSQVPCQRTAGTKTLEGITSSQERQLRSRKRSDKTEEEKWRDVYRICFPLREDEDPTPIPNPYFELPTLAENAGPGKPSDMARYDEYITRELPKRVRRALEHRIEQELSPVEESLKRQLPDIVRGLYQTLSEDFRKSLGGSPQREEGMGEDQVADSTNLTNDGGNDTKGKGKMVAFAMPAPPMEMEIRDALGGCDGDDASVCGNWAASQPFDMSKPLPPYYEGGLAGLDGWMCGVGQDLRNWSRWPDAGYLSGAIPAADSVTVGDNGYNMFGNDLLALQVPHTSENGRCLPDILGEADALLPLEPLPRKPVPEDLLVKALLVPADLVLVRRPHAARVGRQALVDQHHLARLLVQAELELGVGDQDAPLGGVLAAGVVHGQGQLRDARGERPVADDAGRLLGRDVLVVLAQLGLGGGRVDGAHGEGLALLEAGGHGHAADGAALLVLDPRGARDVAAHDGLHREHLELADLHAAAPDEARLGGGEAVRGGLQADKVCAEAGDLVGQDAEPEGADHGEDGAAARDAVVHDHVVGRGPVRRDEEEGLGVQVEEVADLARGDPGEGVDVDLEDLVGHL
ncbi:hypothetical protein VMCG_08478 [Cytospora schulzeri]|uniref:C2H2-type domain-containing protein n=1 Tax=Cytospora schulzeri TaxID=448051 RepID=A0A423VWH2_9PEZI|nr:hypothetical protein VMCG_08478 [Valsa malicola]